ncbi:MAG: COX15/CtaA family protein [Corynebacterium sp.]|nr:COX15/CtaA family protein [Corynebacterium sp.]
MTSVSPRPPHNAKAGVSLKYQRLISLILLLAQGGITVTGSIVRVTGSGLGCVTWPNCHPGSLVPVPGTAPLIHQAIEFGNRLLTFVVAGIAIAAVMAMHMANRRPELKTYAWLSLAGVVVQALIGAVSVKLNLQWWAVALHFLPSMLLVWIAALLWTRIPEPDDGVRTEQFPAFIRYIAAVAAAALAIVLITGTMVTGSGVHSGDAVAGMQGRLEMDTESLAIAHAICMYVYVALTLLVVVLLYRTKAPKSALRAGLALLAFVAIQWAIGVFQFYMGVPRWTIPFHIGMSSVVTAFTAFFYAQGIIRVRRGTSPSNLG